MSYISELQDGIRHAYGVDSEHVESVPVKEVFRGQTVWEGVVEVFDLTGHSKIKRVYAWSTDDSGTVSRFVPQGGAITSPVDAVRAAIVKEFRDRESTEETKKTR